MRKKVPDRATELSPHSDPDLKTLASKKRGLKLKQIVFDALKKEPVKIGEDVASRLRKKHLTHAAMVRLRKAVGLKKEFRDDIKTYEKKQDLI